ncbi:MAG: sigma-70 family RNA polymerase sigma factor [Phycisphaerales bacterium]|nr:sigma-70 family RNA polymerase sigma factor [Phycisphaerales bacterium]
MSDSHEPTYMQTMTSTTLLEGLRVPNNQTIWNSFVERYRPMIVSYGIRLGLGQTDAEDAAQQALIAFCSAYTEGKYQREQGRLRTWLFGIAKRQILNYRRQGRRREVQVADSPSETNFFDRRPDDDRMEQLWDEEWRNAVLKQCLQEVRRDFDAKSMEAFELFAHQGWPAAKVAEHLQMTSNAVFIAKHRIMKRIRELLPQMEEIW